MLSDILTITDGAINSVIVKDQVLDANISLTSNTDSLNSQIKNVSTDGSSKEIEKESESLNSLPSSLDFENPNRKLPIAPIDNVKSKVLVVEKDMMQVPRKSNDTPCFKGIGFNTKTFHIPDDNDVIAERYITGAKKRLIGEKMKSKKSASYKHPKIVEPTIINSKKQRDTPKSQDNSSTPEHETKNPLAPYLQLQDVLENKIASLVSTLKYADSAEKEFLKNKALDMNSKDDAVLKALNSVAHNLKEMKMNVCCNHTEKDMVKSPKNSPVNINKPPTRSKSSPLSSTVQKGTKPPANKTSKPTLHHQDVLQTPIPRRRPPEPFSNRSNNNLDNKPSGPRISQKGYALLHEILGENETTRSNNSSKEQVVSPSPPKSSVRPSFTHLSSSKSPTKTNTSESRQFHCEVDQILDGTIGLKKSLQDVNREMKSILKGDINLSPVTDSSESERIIHHYQCPQETGTSTTDLISEECPLDKYLARPRNEDIMKLQTSLLQTSPQNDKDQTIHRVADVLRKAQEQRKLLDENVHNILRKRKEMNTFLDPPNNEREASLRRIQKAVDVEIMSINQDIEATLDKGLKQTVKPDKTKTNKPNTKSGKPSNRIPLMDRYQMKNTRNSNAGPRKTTTATRNVEKPSEKVQPVRRKKKPEKPKEPPPASSTAYDDLIMRHIYGRQPQLPARRTLKPKTPPAQTPVTQPQPNLQPSQLPSPKFYFHARESGKENMPVTGDLFPVAIPLAEPSRDPTKRMPIYYSEQQENRYTDKPEPNIQQRKQLSKTSNVAVIEVKHNDSTESESSSVREKIRANLRKRVRDKIRLNVQPLPNVDIDTSEGSSSTTLISSAFESPNKLHHSSTSSPAKKTTYSPEKVNDSSPKKKTTFSPEKIDHASPRKKTPYSSHSTALSPKKYPENENVGEDEDDYDFQDFVAVRDIQQNECSVDDQTEYNDGSTDADQSNDFPMTMVQGGHSSDYQRPLKDDGPPFPPRQSKIPLERENNVEMSNHLETRAQEWLENELLAKIVSQFETQNPDPTLKEMADNASLSEVEIESESTNWMDQVIGLHGIQLFVDAGVPIDKELVTSLVRNVIIERLESLYGYPQPMGRGRDNTEPVEEDLSFQRTVRIQTPQRTPVSSPPITSRAFSHVGTPDQSVGSLVEQSLMRNDEESITEIDEPTSYPLVNTPQQSERDPTPVANVVYPGNNMATPVSSLYENENEDAREREVFTPDRTEVDGMSSLVEQVDFVPTSPERTMSPEDEPIKTPTQKTPPPIHKPPSPVPTPTTPSTTQQTYSSSTAVGLSTFEGISDGEHLFPSQLASEGEEGRGGSEGEPTAGLLHQSLLPNYKTVDEIDEDLFSYEQDFGDHSDLKDLVKGLLNHPPSNRHYRHPLKSDGEITQPQSFSIGEIPAGEKGYGNDEDRTNEDDDTLLEDTLNSVCLHPTNKTIQKSTQNPIHQTTNQPIAVRQRPLLVAERPQATHNVVTKRRNFSTEISEGEAVFDKSNGSREIEDLLSLGQLDPNLQSTVNENTLENANNRDQTNSVTPRVLMVQPRTVENRANETNLDNSSEGQLQLSHLDQPAQQAESNRDDLTSLLSDMNDGVLDLDLSEYDLSTLSGGEL